jgi:hypothetical protein
MVDDDEEMECGSDFSSDFTPHVDKKIKDVCYQCSSWNKKSGKGYYKCLGTSGCPVGRIAYKEPRG